MPEPCDILMLYASYGAGHYQVCSTMEQQLGKTAPHLNVVLVDILKQSETIGDKTFGRMYQRGGPFIYGVFGAYYSATRKLKPRSFLHDQVNRFHIQPICQMLSQYQPSVVLATYYMGASAADMLIQQGRWQARLFTLITDITMHSQWVYPSTSGYLVANRSVADQMRDFGVPAQKLHATGIPVREQFSMVYDPQDARAHFRLDAHLPVVLVLGGGTGVFQGMDQFLAWIGNHALPMQCVWVTGHNTMLYKRIETLAQHSKTPLIPIGFVENMSMLMDAASFMLGKSGGITVSESMVKGLPMIVYKPISGPETNNLSYLLSQQACWHATDFTALKRLVTHLLANPDHVKLVSDNCRRIASPHAGADAARILLAALNTHDDGKERP